MPRTGRSESAVRMSFTERTSFPFQQYRRIADFIGQRDPIAHIFSVLWFGKVILRDSKTKSFPSICYDRQEEVVVVTASFVTRKTYLGNLGDPFPQPTPSKGYVLRTFPQFKVILFYARNLKLTYVGNLGTIIGAKSCHSVTLSRLNISYVDGTPVVQKG